MPIVYSTVDKVRALIKANGNCLDVPHEIFDCINCPLFPLNRERDRCPVRKRGSSNAIAFEELRQITMELAPSVLTEEELVEFYL